MVDLARWLMGDIAAVGASLGFSRDRQGPDGLPMQGANDSARRLVEFANGCNGLINVSSVALTADRGQEMRIALHGEGGTVQFDSKWKDGARVYAARQGEKTLEERPIPEELWRGVDRNCPPFELMRRIFSEHPVGCRAFVDAIVEGRDVTPSFYDGWKAQEVIEAAVESHTLRTYVSV